MNVLAIDLGTSAVKAIVWNPTDGVIARGRADVDTHHPHSGWAEQDAESWWTAVERARADLPHDRIATISLSSQRETFVCLDDNAKPLRPAILWSDGRAATPAGRLQWLRDNEPDVVRRARWLAAPKDYVLHKLTGRLVTDTTLAARTDIDPALLPEIVEPRTCVGDHAGVAVFAGAGDRACEVYAVGATPAAPMVSWGTTANVSLPVVDAEVPPGWVGSLDVNGATLLEAGLSAAGAALGWLAATTGTTAAELTTRALGSPVGAAGVIALPWFNGARAPWWRPDAQATFLGITAATTPADLARAIYEGVAHDIRRALAMLRTPPTQLRLAGGGAAEHVWREVLGGVTGLPTVYSVGADAAAIGAAMLAVDGETRSPADPTPRSPSAALVATYQSLSPAHDAAAASVLGSTG